MQTVKVQRLELLFRIRANMAAHRDLFLKAQDGYRKVVVQELDAMLERARTGQRIETRVRVQAPEDHTEDYERVIAMLEMSVDDQVTLSAADFNCYARDRWNWSALANWKNSTYSTGTAIAESAMFPGEPEA